MRHPKVTVGMPVRNGRNFIAKALDSILSQEYKDFELVISDNASDDGTDQICKEYVRRDERIRYERSDVNRGAAWNYNRVFELARGEYFKWATHDDECLPAFLSECVAVLDRTDRNVGLVYPGSVWIDAEGRQLYPDTEDLQSISARPWVRLARILSKVNQVNAIFGLFRSETLARTRLIGRFFASDYVLMAEIALLAQIRQVPAILFRRRHHGGMCMQANKTNAEVRRWFDPQLAGADWRDFLLPRGGTDLRLFFEWERSVAGLPLHFHHKVAAAPVVPVVWFGRRLRNFAGLQKGRIKRFLRQDAGIMAERGTG